MTTTFRPLGTLTLAAALIAPLAALAGDDGASGQGPRFDTTPSTLTRAEVIEQLARHDPNAVGPDGWRHTAGYSVYVGTPGAGKTRAEVQRELAEFKRHPVGADGWALVGDSLRYVGRYTKTPDARLADDAARSTAGLR